MKRLIFILINLLLVFVLSENIYAQLKVFNTGNVGIDATNPLSRFTVGGDGFSDSKVAMHNTNAATNQKSFRVYQAKPNGTWVYGIFSVIEAGSTNGFPVGIFGSGYRGSTAYSTGRSIGVKGQAGNSTSGYNYSIYGELMGSNNGAAIYGVTPGKGDVNVGGIYAGYFRGNVKIENDLNVLGVFTNSDINLKKDIRNLDNNNISKLNQLQAIKYKLKTPVELDLLSIAEKDTAKVLYTDAELNDPIYQKEYIGLSAQALQVVYPEIVKVEDNGNLSVNYIALIPILIEAIKEQQKSIEELQEQVDILSNKN